MFDLNGMLFLGTVAVGTVYFGCVTCPTREDMKEGELVEVTWMQALMFPVTSSAVLLLMFYHFWVLQYIVLFLVVTGSSSAVYDILVRLGNHYLKTENDNRVKYGAMVVSAVVLLEWLLNGNWIAHNILGVSLSLLFIAAMRFPNLKVATLCMLLLFVYDLFWVFGSEHVAAFEGKNVMVEVATKQASNPVNDIGHAVGSSWLQQLGQKHIELPIKLLYPVEQVAADGRAIVADYMMLGLGDIALPGLLVNLALQFDREHGASLPSAFTASSMEQGEDPSKRHPSHPLLLFQHAWVGYSVGLACAFLCSLVFKAAQPALIYLVPGILLPLLCRAHFCGVLGELWHGVKRDRE